MVFMIKQVPSHGCMIYDDMVILQQIDLSKLTTFGDLSELVVKRIMANDCQIIYFVTDQ